MMLPFLPPGSSRLLVAKNTVSQLVGRVVSSASILVATILIARTFGPQGYGELTKITSYVALFYLLADFGINAMYLQLKKEDGDETWNTLLGLRLVGSILLMFMAIAILSFLPRGSSQGYTDGVRFGIIVFAPAILFQAIITTTNALFQEKLRYDLSMVAVVCGSLVTLGLVWLVTVSTAPLVGPVAAVIAFLVGSGVTALLALVLVKQFGTIRVKFDAVVAKQFLLASIPLGLTLLFNQIYFRIDSIILTLTRSTIEVGVYGFAYKFFDVALVLPTFFMNSVYPLLLTVSGDKFRHMLWRSCIFLLVTSIVLVILMWMGSPLITRIRPDFAGSVGALRILSLSLPLFFVSSLTMWTIIAQKRQMILIPIYGVSMIVNIILNSVFIPSHGYIAAAWITVLSEAIVLLATGVIAVTGL
ncbi:hypothetical protein A2875_01740 [Candidatus Gottesmanbacteria bacterium RIFCSPHIGHO2_01_FULL_46_14]|uniref:Uncharacterized protein n=2 Tax=Candidatus Gottesmaniibacteriota TaxID=1752720 RepID=A0A1F5ZQG5_9BACT|nr:MAG: hypothetical protein A2875_01740 [Candidatus Gottesmanbacteria bacterium RIFCSPHIGHO2_01_FULL_46_14]OGG29390.1 MAG: hypothetical protein A2971_01815 [Candidatus Gottesmanbacteria bacterium RIFCSPLOWO2_01_FULL_46_21]